MTQRANEKMKNILDTYTPEPLPREVKENIDNILAAAEQRVKNQIINN
jgi:trimethylamine:corrinoid methyltransferase-like protein